MVVFGKVASTAVAAVWVICSHTRGLLIVDAGCIRSRWTMLITLLK